MKEPARTKASEEVAHDGPLAREVLAPVADQLVQLAERLRRTATGEETSQSPSRTDRTVPPDTMQSASGEDPESDPTAMRVRYAELARQVYELRRLRGGFFGDPDLFGEPAWDILLDLYIAHVKTSKVSVSSACIGSAAPPTTGLRWLGILAEQGLVLREHDPDDQRRVLVRLTDRGLEAMDRYFSEAAKRSAIA